MDLNNMTDTILTNEQVKKLSDSIMIDVNREIDALIKAAEDKIDLEVNEHIGNSKLEIDELYKLYAKSATIHKNINSLKDKLDGGDNDAFYIDEYHRDYTKEDVADDIKRNRKSYLLRKNKLSWNDISELRETVVKKVKAILCTLTNNTYEEIVKTVHDKLNLNDLFDNRNKQQ